MAKVNVASLMVSSLHGDESTLALSAKTRRCARLWNQMTFPAFFFLFQFIHRSMVISEYRMNMRNFAAFRVR